MRTIETVVYNFDELTEDAKNKAVIDFGNINIEDEWWINIFEDAKNIGLEITAFSLDRANYCNGKFINSAEECAENIIKEHGEDCDTYKIAKDYLSDREIILKSMDDSDGADSEFLDNILDAYKSLLKKEYEYQTSDEVIIETIKSNEYEFTIDGKII